jgi:hypothetical protein
MYQKNPVNRIVVTIQLGLFSCDLLRMHASHFITRCIAQLGWPCLAGYAELHYGALKFLIKMPPLRFFYSFSQVVY